MAEAKHLEISLVKDVTLVRFLERRILDELSIQEIGDELFRLTEGVTEPKILLDFQEVEFLSSAALGKLITLDKKVKSKEGKLKLCGIHPEIFKVFEITRLNEVFDIRSNHLTGISAFSSG